MIMSLLGGYLLENKWPTYPTFPIVLPAFLSRGLEELTLVLHAFRNVQRLTLWKLTLLSIQLAHKLLPFVPRQLFRPGVDPFRVTEVPLWCGAATSCVSSWVIGIITRAGNCVTAKGRLTFLLGLFGSFPGS